MEFLYKKLEKTFFWYIVFSIFVEYIPHMLEQPIETINLSFRERLKTYLSTEGRSQRWLMRKLKNKDFFFTQTQLSNRINGFVDFKEQEKRKINEVLGTEF